MNNSKVLATVNGQPITDADVDAMIQSLAQRGQRVTSQEERRAVLEQVINQKLLHLDAVRNLYEREPAFKAQLAQLKDSLLVSYALEKAFENIRVSDADVKKYYEEHPDQFAGEETVSASHILVDTEAEATDIRKRLDDGLTFETAARQYSKCPSGAQGGSLGEFGKGQMVPEFEQAAFSMEPGAISQPVKTQFGYHIIRLDGKHAAEKIPFEQVKEQIRAHLLAEKRQAAYRSKINQLKILYPVDLF